MEMKSRTISFLGLSAKKSIYRINPDLLAACAGSFISSVISTWKNDEHGQFSLNCDLLLAWEIWGLRMDVLLTAVSSPNPATSRNAWDGSSGSFQAVASMFHNILRLIRQ